MKLILGLYRLSQKNPETFPPEKLDNPEIYRYDMSCKLMSGVIQGKCSNDNAAMTFMGQGRDAFIKTKSRLKADLVMFFGGINLMDNKKEDSGAIKAYKTSLNLLNEWNVFQLLYLNGLHEAAMQLAKQLLKNAKQENNMYIVLSCKEYVKFYNSTIHPVRNCLSSINDFRESLDQFYREKCIFNIFEECVVHIQHRFESDTNLVQFLDSKIKEIKGLLTNEVSDTEKYYLNKLHCLRELYNKNPYEHRVIATNAASSFNQNPFIKVEFLTDAIESSIYLYDYKRAKTLYENATNLIPPLTHNNINLQLVYSQLLLHQNNTSEFVKQLHVLHNLFKSFSPNKVANEQFYLLKGYAQALLNARQEKASEYIENWSFLQDFNLEAISSLAPKMTKDKTGLYLNYRLLWNLYHASDGKFEVIINKWDSFKKFLSRNGLSQRDEKLKCFIKTIDYFFTLEDREKRHHRKKLTEVYYILKEKQGLTRNDPFFYELLPLERHWAIWLNKKGIYIP